LAFFTSSPGGADESNVTVPCFNTALGSALVCGCELDD
jgi:hypothetical protein